MSYRELGDVELIRAYLAADGREAEAPLDEYRRRGWLTNRRQTTAKYRRALKAYFQSSATGR